MSDEWSADQTNQHEANQQPQRPHDKERRNQPPAHGFAFQRLVGFDVDQRSDEPDHQELCAREQRYFRRAITEGLDLSDHMRDAVNSLRIVLAADESVRSGRTVELD